MWVLSNLSLWMWSVAAAWMMVELHVAAVWVALVQAAMTIPLLIFGLPFGAIADMVNRKRLLLLTQAWLGAAALTQGGLALAGMTSAAGLLAMTFAYGCGVAMRNPTYHATVPELVPREYLPSALALNAAGINASRVMGPLIAGLVIVFAGPHAAFLMVAVVSGISVLVVNAWKPAATPDQRRPASFGESLRGGLAFALKSRPFQSNLLRVSAFCAAVTALPALLPLIARSLENGDASTFSMLFAAMGGGAVLSMSFLHRLRARYPRDSLEMAGAIFHALAVLALVVSRSQAVAIVAMTIAGWAWIMTANSMSITAQLILPDEVRARGIAIYQMALMGSLALGAAWWGQVATLTSVHTSLAISGICAPLGVGLAMYVMRKASAEE